MGANTMTWIVRLICCGRDGGEYRAVMWKEADDFRESYTKAKGHERTGIIVAASAPEGEK